MKKQKSNPYKYLLLLISILFCGLVYAITITDLYNYDSPLVTSNSSILLGWNFTMENGEQPYINFSWDNVNYSLMNGLVLFYNFDNRSSLSENDTFVRDLSGLENNGTVVGGSNISWTPNCRSTGNGCFNFAINSISNISYITVLDSDSLANNYTSMTWSFWAYRNYSDVSMGMLDKQESSGNLRSWRISGSTSGLDEIDILLSTNGSSGTSAGTYTSTNDCGISSNNIWYQFTIVYNGTALFWYKDGNLCETNNTVTQNQIFNNNQNLQIGRTRNYNKNWKGMLDEIMIFNKSLSASEVSQLYKSQLTKYDSQNWSFQTNQTLTNVTLLNSTNPSDSFNYYLCSSNSSSSENCTSQKTITQTIPNKNVVANFTNSIGNIRNDFYGVAHYYATGVWFSDSTANNIDKTGNSVFDAPTDTNWNKQTFNNANLKVIRWSLPIGGGYYSNSSDGTVNFTGDYTNHLATMKYCYENGIKVLFNIYQIPSWLGNSSSWCSSNNASCPPSNYTILENIINDSLYRITNNKQYLSVIEGIEIGNEPSNHGGAWLTDLSNDNITRAEQYVIYYNQTYDIIKRYDSSIQVGGFAQTATWSIMANTFFSNMTNKMDFIGIHSYSNPDFLQNTNTTGLVFIHELNLLKGFCSTYSSPCNKIIFSEWGHYGTLGTISNLQNNSVHINKYSTSLSSAYASIFNYNSEGLNIENITLVYYQFSEPYPYWGSYYPQYPYLHSMVSEAGLDNPTATYYPPYNVTKNFAHLCPAGSTVYSSSSDDDNLKTVTCKNGNQRSVIVINTGTESKNVTINLTNSGITTLKNYENTDTWTASGSTNLGILDSYGILYLGEDLQSPTLTIDSPTSSTYSTTTIYFNITLDEEGDTCVYSLNNFLTNYSMAKQGWVNSFKASAILTTDDYNYTAIFWCNDTSGNSATNSVEFRLDACPNNYFLSDDGLSCTATAPQSICNNFFDAGIGFTGFIVVIIIISIGSIVILFLTGGDADMDMTTLIAGAIIIGSIVLAIGMKIVYAINGC